MIWGSGKHGKNLYDHDILRLQITFLWTVFGVGFGGTPSIRYLAVSLQMGKDGTKITVVPRAQACLLVKNIIWLVVTGT